MANPFKGTPLAEPWDAMRDYIAEGVEDGHYLEDTLETRRRLAEADDLARELEAEDD